MRSLVVGVAVVLRVGLAGCKKAMNNSDSGESSGPYSGGGNPTAGGAAQAVRGAVNRTVTAVEMHDLFILMNYAKGSTGRVPTKQETWNLLSQPDGNQKLRSMIQDSVIILVDNPQEEGLWAYAADVKTMGGFILTHVGEERVTTQDFGTRFPGY